MRILFSPSDEHSLMVRLRRLLFWQFQLSRMSLHQERHAQASARVGSEAVSIAREVVCDPFVGFLHPLIASIPASRTDLPMLFVEL